MGHDALIITDCPLLLLDVLRFFSLPLSSSLAPLLSPQLLFLTSNRFQYALFSGHILTA